MSTPVTAQAFRDAAATACRSFHPPCGTCPLEVLLLAAAEQGEQLAAMQQLSEADNRTQAAYREQLDSAEHRIAQCIDQLRKGDLQIATLTAERDEALKAIERITASALGTIATLTQERDALAGSLQQLIEEAMRTAEAINRMAESIREDDAELH